MRISIFTPLKIYTREDLNPDAPLPFLVGAPDTIHLRVTLPLNTEPDALRVGKPRLQPCSPVGAT
jgi:hypothetical protein